MRHEVAERSRASEIDSVVQALHARFGTTVELAALAAEVEAEFSLCGDARITDFVPILVMRRVRTRLRADV